MKNHNTKDCRKGKQKSSNGGNIIRSAASATYVCGKVGHRAARCHDKKDGGCVGSGVPKLNALVALTSEAPLAMTVNSMRDEEWLLDSGVREHMVGCDDALQGRPSTVQG